MDAHFADTEIQACTEIVVPGPSAAVFASTLEDEHNWRWRKAFHDLQRCGGLVAGWDGEGGSPPDARTWSVAMKLLSQWRASIRNLPPVRILPTSGGTILIEWQEAPRYVEAEITKSGQVEWMRIDGDEPATHWVTAAGNSEQPDFGNWAHTTLNPVVFAVGDD